MRPGRARSEATPRGLTARRQRRSAGIVWALTLGLLAGCGGSSSNPTLDPGTTITLSGQFLVPVPGGLCHVRGTIQSLSLVRVDVSLQWQAVAADASALGTTTLAINDLNPGEVRAFESTGFVSSDRIIACSQIDSFNLKHTTVTKA